MIRQKVQFHVVALGMVLAVMGMLLFWGCGGGGGTATSGVMRVAITDKQSDAFQQVWVRIREIRVVPAGRENAGDNDPGLPVVVRFGTPLDIDVMQLQFQQQVLGEVALPAGSYTQMRLVLEPNPAGQGQQPVNYVVLKSDPNTRVPLTTPSGQQSGLKVLGEITVKAGVITAVMIDFDPNTAIVARGNGQYNLKPTGIRLVQMATLLASYGSLNGMVVSLFKDFSSATVAVRRRGAVDDQAPIAAGAVFSGYTSGRWQAPFAAFVPPSTADIRYKAFVTSRGFSTYSSALTGVVAGQASDLGDLTLTTVP